MREMDIHHHPFFLGILLFTGEALRERQQVRTYTSIIRTIAHYIFFSRKFIHKLANRYWYIALWNYMTSSCNWRAI